MTTDNRDPEPTTGAEAGEADTVDGVDRPSFRITAGVIRPAAAVSRYQRGREIARGGLGRVTAALDRTLQRQVAIKELHQHTEHGARRFTRESLTTARLQHPAIVPVFDAGTSDHGDPYLVMKLLEGNTLAEELRDRTSTEARLALLPSLLAVADALGYAHAQGVVHRDVKPSNIMIGRHGETVLVDWGVAHDASAAELESDGLGRGPEPALATRDTSEPLTIIGGLAGTVRFMSPEQARGEPVQPGFDVFSLGLTMATVLSGQTPFGELGHDTILERLRAHETAVPALPDGVPADLCAIIAKATAPSGARYAHAGLLSDDLRKFIAGQLVSARRYTTGELVGRWVRRHRVLLATAAVAVATIAVISIVAIESVIHERNLAIAEREQALARERELILIEARASLRTDPTATIAWLKQYPATAPRQDEVLQLVDEAAGRGVARHVWHVASAVTDVDILDDRAVISAHRDGSLVRAELDTGATRRLGQAGAPLAFATARGDTLAVLDQDGQLYRWTSAGLARDTVVQSTLRVSGLYATSDAGELKVTFVDGEARYLSGGAHPAPAGYALTDDENHANIVYAVSPTGVVAILDPTPRPLCTLAPRTWIRSSHDGHGYAAFEPRVDQATAVWVGTADGALPTAVGITPPCMPGQDQARESEVANDASIVAVQQCGVLFAFDRALRRPIEIANPDRVGSFDISPDARWLALGRDQGAELHDLRTGEIRQLASTSAISQTPFSRDSRWLVSVGVEQGIRAWSLERAPGAPRVGRLADVVEQTRLYATGRADELAVRRHLGCGRWSPAEGRLTASFGVTARAIRSIDDELLLWAWDASDDGRACIFAGHDGTAIVARDGGALDTLVAPPAATLGACILGTDGATAVCRGDDRTLVSFEVATGTPTVHQVDGIVRGIARYRGEPVVLVESSRDCRLETLAGKPLATLPGGADCRSLRASAGITPGQEAALVVGRTRGVDVWADDAGAITIPTEHRVVEVARAQGLVAQADGRAVEIWTLRDGHHRTARVGHALAVGVLAWSSAGLLASADDDTVRLWDPTTDRTRVLFAPHVLAMVWSADARSLFTSDGRTVQTWPIDVTAGSSVSEVHARLEQLTTAEIVDGQVVTRGAR